MCALFSLDILQAGAVKGCCSSPHPQRKQCVWELELASTGLDAHWYIIDVDGRNRFIFVCGIFATTATTMPKQFTM